MCIRVRRNSRFWTEERLAVAELELMVNEIIFPVVKNLLFSRDADLVKANN